MNDTTVWCQNASVTEPQRELLLPKTNASRRTESLYIILRDRLFSLSFLIREVQKVLKSFGKESRQTEMEVI